MRVLVVTPTLGRSPWLSATLAGVAALRGSRIHHVLVAPHDAIRDLERRAGGARLVSERGGGMYAAINDGVRACADEPWEWFTYLNDDDTWLNGMSVVLDRADKPGLRATLFGRVRLTDAQDRALGELPVARRESDFAALLARGIVPLAQPGTLVHRCVLESLGGFDESFRSAGDLDLFVRALVAGHSFEFVDAHVASFRLHAGQISKDERAADAEKERALRPLRAAGIPGGVGALLRFRLANAGAYFARARHFGVVRMRQVYRTK